MLARDTRLAKLDAPDGPYAALILAKAGLVRMDLGGRITADLTPPVLFYAVSQGALGVEIRSDDAEALELCKKITHQETQWRCLAERAFLRVLEGGCSVPVGVVTTLDMDSERRKGVLNMTGCVTGLDGTDHVEHTLKEEVDSVETAEAVGQKLARVLIDGGARRILEAINQDKETRLEAAQADEEKK